MIDDIPVAIDVAVLTISDQETALINKLKSPPFNIEGEKVDSFFAQAQTDDLDDELEFCKNVDEYMTIAKKEKEKESFDQTYEDILEELKGKSIEEIQEGVNLINGLIKSDVNAKEIFSEFVTSDRSQELLMRKNLGLGDSKGSGRGV